MRLFLEKLGVGVGGRDYLRAISVLRASSGCPRRYTGMPLVS